MSNIDVLILCSALFGVVLSLVNWWHLHNSGRVRLRVVPKLAFDTSHGRYTTNQWNEQSRRLQESGAQSRWMVEVINLSTFPLTIDEVGFSDHTVAGNYAMVDPEIARGKTWPVRLTPREKALFYSTDGVLLPERVWLNPCAYAKTDCGSCVYGKSPILTDVGAEERKRRPRLSHTN